MSYYRFFNLHLPGEVVLFRMPSHSVRRWDNEAVVYDVRIGDLVLRHYGFKNHWFEVNCTLDLSGRFITEPGPIDWCFNCDIATPTFTEGTDGYSVDLCLDVLAGPDGRTHVVIDQEDFAEAIARGWISPAEEAGARNGLADLLQIINTTGLVHFLHQVYPFGDVSDAGVQPLFEKLKLSQVPLLAR